MLPGVPERRSFDCVRHGTIDLFAALNIATGTVMGQVSAQHQAVDLHDFLDQIDRQTDPGLAVHVDVRRPLHPQGAGGAAIAPRPAPGSCLRFTQTYSSSIDPG